jgi:hypothetical protein
MSRKIRRTTEVGFRIPHSNEIPNNYKLLQPTTIIAGPGMSQKLRPGPRHSVLCTLRFALVRVRTNFQTITSYYNLLQSSPVQA